MASNMDPRTDADRLAADAAIAAAAREAATRQAQAEAALGRVPAGGSVSVSEEGRSR